MLGEICDSSTRPKQEALPAGLCVHSLSTLTFSSILKCNIKNYNRPSPRTALNCLRLSAHHNPTQVQEIGLSSPQKLMRSPRPCPLLASHPLSKLPLPRFLAPESGFELYINITIEMHAWRLVLDILSVRFSLLSHVAVIRSF